MWRVVGRRIGSRMDPLVSVGASIRSDRSTILSILTRPLVDATSVGASTQPSSRRSPRRRYPSRRCGDFQQNNPIVDRDAINGVKKRARELIGSLSLSSSQTLKVNPVDLRATIDVVNDWSALKLPLEEQRKVLQTIDDLLVKCLEQLTNDRDIARTSTQHLPSSKALCSLVIAWSKSDLPHAAERAEYWLQEMIRLAEKYSDSSMAPRPSLFSPVLSAWEKRARNDPETATRRGEVIWRQLQLLVRGADDKKATFITSSAFYMYLSLLSKSGLPDSPLQAEAVLHQMVQSGKMNDVVPECRAFVNVISAWNRSDFPEAPVRTQAILDLMVTEHLRRLESPKNRFQFALNDVPFNATIQSWVTAATNQNSEVSPVQAEECVHGILQTMQDLNVRPTPITVWNILPLYECGIENVSSKIMEVIGHAGGSVESRHSMVQNQAFLKAVTLCREESKKSIGNVEAALAAEEILFSRYMKLQRRQRRLEPIMQAFVCVMQAWKYQIDSKTLPSGFVQQRMQAVLKKMEEESERILQHKANPSVLAFLAQASAENATCAKALEQVEEITLRLLDLYKGDAGFALRLSWLQQIVERVKENFPEQQSSRFSHNLYEKLTRDAHRFLFLISSVSRRDLKFHHSDQEFLESILTFLANEPSASSGKRAEMLLLTMQDMQEKGDVRPLTFETFKKVLLCWSKSLEAGSPQRAERILSLAEELYEAGDEAMQPDFDGYLAVIDAWSRSFSSEAPGKIKMHLLQIKKRRDEGDASFGMKDAVYASLIRAYGNIGNEVSKARAEEIFNAMPEKMRTTPVYNAFIEAQGGDANKAEEILQDMHHLCTREENGSVKPETETFNAVIQAWVRSGSPMAAWRADGIFKKMQELAETSHLDVNPNSRTFDLVISSLAQSDGVELKIDAYLSLLKRQYAAGRLDCQPTITTYLEAMKVWCSKEDDPRAFLRAKALLDEMHELAREGLHTVRPNRKTYELFLEALCRSSVDARAELAKDVVEKMKEDSVEVQGDARRLLQRCFLPVDRPMSSFVLKVADNSNLVSTK